MIRGRGISSQTTENRRCTMRVYRKMDEFARKFDAAYPEELPARLQWWSKTLDIDRVRLLRMIGMSARQATQKKDEDLKEILKSPDWEANARLVEGGLHRLLSLYQYDWPTLAERIHRPVKETEKPEASRVTRRKGAVKQLRDTPNGDAAGLLINRMAEGGPQSMSALLAFLAESPAVACRADS